MSTRKSKSRQPSSEPQTVVNAADSPEAIQLRNWVSALAARFTLESADIDVKTKGAYFVAYLYTNSCKYAITAKGKTPERSSTYLGCTLDGYADSPGGRDLADGDFSEKTWHKILSDIVSWEMISPDKGRARLSHKQKV